MHYTFNAGPCTECSKDVLARLAGSPRVLCGTPRHEDVSIPSNSGTWSRTFAVSQSCGDVRPCGAMRRAFGGSRRQRGEFAPFLPTQQHGFCAWVARLACRPASPGKTEPLFAVRGLGGGLAVPFPAASAAAVALAMRTVGIAPARPGLVKPWFPIMLPWGNRTALDPREGCQGPPGSASSKRSWPEGRSLWSWEHPRQESAPAAGRCRRTDRPLGPK